LTTRYLYDIGCKGYQKAEIVQKPNSYLTSLNYPNIATINRFEESDAVRYLVMELVIVLHWFQELKRLVPTDN
jgi:hypothetical protein